MLQAEPAHISCHVTFCFTRRENHDKTQAENNENQDEDE
jgi:hypothetical protein